jgi:general secretion pathway protein J
MNSPQTRGFTLIEMLVAVALLSVLALLSWRGLDAVISARTWLTEQTDEARAIHLAFGQIERDAGALAPMMALPDLARRSAPRPVMPPTISVVQDADAPALSLLRSVQTVEGATRMQQVVYALRDHGLERSASVPGTALPIPAPQDPVRLLDGVSRWGIRAYVTDRGWATLPLPADLPATARVTGLEITLERGDDKYVRMVAL